jgi:hypothetical protein
MRTRLTTISLILALIWAVSFAFCLIVPITARIDIPELFPDVIKGVFDTFATPLGVVLGFLFSGELAKQANSKSVKQKSSKTSIVGPKWVDGFAVFATLLYCGIFDYFMFLFAIRRSNAESVITGFSQVRPYVAFLITGIMAFYFGKSKE